LYRLASNHSPYQCLLNSQDYGSDPLHPATSLSLFVFCFFKEKRYLTLLNKSNRCIYLLNPLGGLFFDFVSLNNEDMFPFLVLFIYYMYIYIYMYVFFIDKMHTLIMYNAKHCHTRDQAPNTWILGATNHTQALALLDLSNVLYWQEV
jgi:hypothetical protein